MFSLSQLSPITYIAFGILGYVVYLYIRQRAEYNRYLSTQPISQETQPTFQPQRPFGSLGVQTPTFSAQEVEQRKPAKEIDQSSLKPRSLQTLPEFSGHQGVPSSFGPKQQSYESTEKMFGGFKKSVPYEPTPKPAEPSSSGFAQPGRSQPPSSFYPPPAQLSSRAFTQDVLHSLVSEPAETKIQQEPRARRPSIGEMKEEGFIAPRKQSIGDQTSVPVDKYGSELDLDREYKVFSQEFKQKEGKVFHDAKKLESPNRFGRGSVHSHFDRASHSPDSPFKFFENKGDKDSQKRLRNEEQEVSKGKKSAGDVKEESSTLARGRARESAPSDLTRPSKIAAKTEKRQKQIFMDVGSDDEGGEMLIEREKKQGILHKRSAAESGSIDEIEKESFRGKYFKDNNNQGKHNKPQEDIRKSSVDQGSLSPSRLNESQGSSKRRSVADISYLSEYGANTSMKRYIEKKASQGYAEKPERHSVAPSLAQKYVNPLVPAKDTRHSFPQSQEPKKLEVPKPAFTSLIQPSQKGLGQAASPNLTSTKKTVPGGFLLTNEPKSPSKDLLTKKPEKKEIEEEKPIVPEKKIGGGSSLFTQKDNKVAGGGSLFANTEKIVEEKPAPIIPPKTETKPAEPVSITSLLTSNLNKPIESSLFTQKPVETKKEEPVVKSPIIESQPKQAETQVKETNSIIGKDFDIFKTVRPGTTFPGKPEENKPAAEDNGASKEEKIAAADAEFQKKKGLFFGGGLTTAAEGSSFKDFSKEKTATEEAESQKKTTGLFFGGAAKPAAEENGSKYMSKEKYAEANAEFLKKKEDYLAQKEESSKPENEQEAKTEAKPLFGGFGSGGMFANIAKSNSNPPTKPSEEDSSNKNETATTSGGFISSFKSSSSPVASQTPLFGGGAFMKREDSKNSGTAGFFGTNKTADGDKGSQESAKGATSLFSNKEPAATENGGSSPKKPGINGGSLFGNLPKTAGSSSLFGSKLTEESKPSAGGLFSNMTPGASIGSGGLFANNTSKPGGLFSNAGKDTEQK